MFTKIFTKILDALFMIAASMVAGMTGLVVVDTVLRYAFDRPTIWVSDVVTIYLMPSLAFLPAAWVLKNRGHVRVSILIDRLQPSRRYVMEIAINVVQVVFSIMLAWYGAEWAVADFRHHYVTSTAIPYPTFVLGGLVSVSGVTLCIVSIIEIVNIIKGIKR